ncbi:uncharacterized protein LOC134668338 [Cydia fagiglandana]|uniref:uncharacterized protein LOC134668338 n=1 Tax=Cydia fagiglandana TaxID=1458189 RepID=UPI002FEE5E64
MNTSSTEIISKSYSSLSGQNKYEFNRIDYYSITKNNSSGEAEVFNDKDMNSKNASSPTIGKLSAQVMNLPYNDYKVITDEAFESRNKFSLKEYDILKRIKEAYDACSCKICRCLMGPTIIPRAEYCDCEPCKCKDCTLNNLRFNTINLQLRSRNEFINVKETSCDCRPCNCMECTQNCSFRSKPINYDKPIGINKHLGRPITTNEAYSIGKCGCSKCECIICESQGNALTCYSSLRYGNKPSRKLTCPEFSKYSTWKNQHTSDLIDYANRDMFHFEQCVRNSEPQNDLNKINPDNNHGGSNKPSVEKHPLTYERNEYAHDKFRRGNIFYVNNVRTYNPTKKILRPKQPIIKENIVGLPLPKDNNQNSKNKSQGKSTQFDKYTVLTAGFNTNALELKTSLCNVSVELYPHLNILGDFLPMNNVQKTSSYSISSGFSSTRTTTSSSVLKYQNKGCSKRTISLPDTNIFNNHTEIGSNFNTTEDRKYVISDQHNIYNCSNIESEFNKISGIGVKLVRKLHKYPNDIGNRVAGNVLFDNLNHFFTKRRCNVEQTNTDNYNSIHKTVLNAKKFTINLTKILNKYEKANLEFKSVSKKLKTSLYMVLNNLSSSKCDCIIKQAAVIEENNGATNASTENDPGSDYSERFEIVNQKFKKFKEENELVEVETTKNVNIDTLKNHKKHSEQDGQVLKIITRVTNESQDNIEKVCDERRNIVIKSALVDKSQMHGITEPEPEPVTSEVELLRAKKIRNILKQNMMLDLYTE